MNDKVEKNANGNAEKEKTKFDWVTERFSCSLPAVFKTLRLQVEEDVKTRNSLRPNNSAYEFSVADTDDGFTVTLQAKEARKSVKFSLAEHAILVRDNIGDPLLDVTLTFSARGECQLIVNNEVRDFWQVRRMALEDLLFHSN